MAQMIPGRRRLKGPILVVLVLCALAAVVVLTRPDPSPKKNPARQPATTPLAATEQKTDLPLNQAPTDSVASSEPRHGPESVVRTRERLAAKGQAPRPPRQAPRWDEPLALRYSKLKKIYRAYRQARDFAPDTVARLSGAAVQIKGAVMPIDPVPASGEMKRFWLANPIVVMAGCVFCLPPTMADLIYVHTTTGEPFEVDRERLYRSVVRTRLLGRLELGPVRTPDGVEYLFGLQLKEVLDR